MGGRGGPRKDSIKRRGAWHDGEIKGGEKRRKKGDRECERGRKWRSSVREKETAEINGEGSKVSREEDEERKRGGRKQHRTRKEER